jgi:hypothetical protein
MLPCRDEVLDFELRGIFRLVQFFQDLIFLGLELFDITRLPFDLQIFLLVVFLKHANFLL